MSIKSCSYYDSSSSDEGKHCKQLDQDSTLSTTAYRQTLTNFSPKRCQHWITDFNEGVHCVSTK